VLSSTTAGVLSWTDGGGSGDYIQNQSATNQSADFRIDGHGYFYGDATSYIDIYASSTDQNIVSTDQMILVSAEGIKLRGPYTQVQTSTAVPYVQFDGGTQRVGIGTTSPGYNLHVAGSARVNSLNINGAYSLPTSAGTTSEYLRGDGTWGTPSGGGSGWSLTGNSGTTAGTNFVGTTDAQDLVFKTNNTEDVRITTAGELAIGNFSNPEAMLEIRETIADIYVRTYNDYSWQDGGRLALQRMGGSQTSPTATQAGYGLGALDFRGGYGISVSGVTTASIKSVSPVTWVSGSSTRGGDLRFYTINISGSQSIYDNERMRIGSQGGVGVNINPTPSSSTNNDPDAYMHVYGGIGIGPVNNSISLTHGQENSIQIASDTYYGGVNDNHSGYLIYSIMPGGWSTGELRFACATDWGVYNTTTPALRVTQSGIYANGTYYSSDRRIKSDFRDMPYGLEQIMALEPLYYSKHIAKDMADGKPVLGESSDEIGFIAQDLFNIIPEVVSQPNDDSAELWGIDYAKMVPVLVQAIQEQQSKIEELENKLESYKELEKRIELLENQ
ncbi:MAG: tail fiber domain-containing protein, partial [bacterium]